MVIEKEDFVKYIKHIETQLDKDDKLSDLLVCEDTTGWVSTAPYLVDDIIELIASSLEDSDEWISWWLWEMDDARTNNKVWCDWNEVSYKFTIADEEDLYYLIVGDLEKIKEKTPEDPPELGIAPSDVCGESSLYDIFRSQMTGYTESNN